MSFRSIVKKLLPQTLFKRLEPYGHWAEAILENILFGFPSKGLNVIGVTGTAGKTTTCTLLTNMLRESGYKVAMMTTISIDYGDGRGARHNTTRMTSVGSLRLIKAVTRMKASGVEWLVLETTSQALAQHRVWGVPYTIVGYTNLSHDNFHYHGTFERYRKAKLMLFKQANRYRKGMRRGVVNIEDESGEYFVKAIKNPITYGLKDGDLRASNVELLPTGTNFTATIGNESYKIKSNLPGVFNVYNCLCAIGISKSIGLSRDQIERGIASLKSVDGRMNAIDLGQDFGVLVDYACTPDSFSQLFKAVTPMAKGKIITVFGSAGRRDELKRPLQGEIAGKYSDILILTEEDDRDQDGQKILDEIEAGTSKAGKSSGKDLYKIHDRTDAVNKAVELAKKDDMVLILGKGEETVIITNKPGFKPSASHIYNEATDTIKIKYNDRNAAEAAIKKKLAKK